MKLVLFLILLVPVYVFSQPELNSLPNLSHKATPTDHDESWCAAAGKGQDGELNLLKNRIDAPQDDSDYYPIAFDVIHGKTFPKGLSGHRAGKNLAPIYRDEGLPIRLQGYILDWTEEGGEKCNCDDKKNFAHRDYHVWLVKDPHDGLKDAVVVELAPRMRAAHGGNWTDQTQLEAELDSLKNNQTEVRIYRWLMFDGEHVNQLDKPGADPKRVRRSTLWEIHPITKIEKSVENGWEEVK